MIRENPENHLLRYGQLFNQFIVDAFVKIETERLGYIRCNQSKLRVDIYIHLKDVFFHDEHITNTGQKCILPSTSKNGQIYDKKEIVLIDDSNEKVF
ncbi:unnamed protein product [Macrosiphum euphorbiae]|uniref:Helitron helicase-like domain-containing protein n=1 Tax=Macrosiphum euphorbiae TaxID=13131 RepID=A0AAV0VQV9_9HEMI|nr:unnamed protein product [Macrosiphum euphorbiae]